MKSTVTTALLLLITVQLFSQLCYREGQFMDGPDYPVKGKATLERQTDGSLLLKFDSNFSTSPGPDLDVYLSNTPMADGSSVNIAALKSTTGQQTYTLPNHVAFEGYEYVIIHCTQFNHFWGNAKLGASIGKCGISSIVEKEQAQVSIFASGNKLNIITSSQVEMKFTAGVYDVLGNLVMMKEGSVNGKTDFTLDRVATGIYFIRLNVGGQEITKKLYFQLN